MTMESDFVTRKIKKRKYPLPLLKQLDILHQLQKEQSQKPLYPYDEKRGIIRLPRSVEDRYISDQYIVLRDSQRLPPLRTPRR